MGDVIKLRSRYLKRLDAAYSDMSNAFVCVLQRHRYDDAALHALVRLVADLIAVAGERKGCGEVWRETMIEAFTRRVKQPIEPK